MSAIKAEFMKMKHSPWWLLFLLLPVMPAAMGTVNYLNNITLLKSGWYSLWTQETLFYSNFFFGPMIGLCCSYQWRMEHKGKNWNGLMVMPKAKWQLFGAKVSIAILLTFLTQLWVLILYFCTGKMIHLSGNVPEEIIFWFLRGTIGGSVIACVQSFLSMRIKSFSLPIVTALLGSVVGLLISSKGAGIFWPYSLMLVGMNANKTEDMLTGNQMGFYLSCLVYFLLFFAVAVYSLRKKDVK